MPLKHLKWMVFAAFLLAGVNTFAQRKKQTRPATQNNAANNYFGTNNADTTKPGTTKPAANNAANDYFNSAPATPGNNGAGGGTRPGGNSGGRDTTPIEQSKIKSASLLDSLKPSLRNDAAIEQNLVKDRNPLEYDNIREDDAVFRVRVWRQIDTREKLNQPFGYAAVEDNGSQRFISILLQAIKSGQVTAFSGDDDRFTTPITADAAMGAFGSGNDTSKVVDKDGNVVKLVVSPKVADPDSIYKFRLKEEWIFDKEASRLVVRILGIAPVMPVKLSNGITLENTDHPVWWVYYPDMRPVLSKYEVYNAKNYGARMTWEELFESRMFTSYIIKSTMDNPFDQDIAAMYPNNTLFRLLEGDHIKEKIFDYEQSLWQY